MLRTTSSMAHHTTSGLSDHLTKILRTFFDLFDEQKSGFVNLCDIQHEIVQTIPMTGLLESLQKVTNSEGKISYERFLAGVKMTMLRNHGTPEKKKSVQDLLPHNNRKSKTANSPQKYLNQSFESVQRQQTIDTFANQQRNLNTPKNSGISPDNASRLETSIDGYSSEVFSPQPVNYGKYFHNQNKKLFRKSWSPERELSSKVHSDGSDYGPRSLAAVAPLNAEGDIMTSYKSMPDLQKKESPQRRLMPDLQISDRSPARGMPDVPDNQGLRAMPDLDVSDAVFGDQMLSLQQMELLHDGKYGILANLTLPPYYYHNI